MKQAVSMRRKKTGRLILCSSCACLFTEGTTQVYQRIVFQFCKACWRGKREFCNSFMRDIGSIDAA